jgi:hypothetical protein
MQLVTFAVPEPATADAHGDPTAAGRARLGVVVNGGVVSLDR